jgi:hypothetical protein
MANDENNIGHKFLAEVVGSGLSSTRNGKPIYRLTIQVQERAVDDAKIESGGFKPLKTPFERTTDIFLDPTDDNGSFNKKASDQIGSKLALLGYRDTVQALVDLPADHFKGRKVVVECKAPNNPKYEPGWWMTWDRTPGQSDKLTEDEVAGLRRKVKALFGGQKEVANVS